MIEISLYFLVLFTRAEKHKLPNSPAMVKAMTIIMMILVGCWQPRPTNPLSMMLRYATTVPKVRDITRTNFQQFLFLKRSFSTSAYLLFLVECSTSACLLGGMSGFYLIKIVNRMKGILTIIAYNRRKDMICYLVLSLSMKIPGRMRPMESERKLESTHRKVT